MTFRDAGFTSGPVDATGATVSHAHLPLGDGQRLRALELLSAAESERQRRNPSDAFLLGRLLLQDLAVAVTGATVAITAACDRCGEEHGRPVSDTLWLSVAHTGDLVVAAAAPVPVGIDVEPADVTVPVDFGGTVAAWTRLEAVLKADGRGVVVDPAEVRFKAPATTPANAAVTTTVTTTATLGDAVYRVATATRAHAGTDYVLSVATES